MIQLPMFKQRLQVIGQYKSKKEQKEMFFEDVAKDEEAKKGKATTTLYNQFW